MQRYFMTISEACQLVIALGRPREGGEVFVLDMGEPMRIMYLAERMIRLSGKIPGKDVAIEFIGPRPGEKLSEELFRPVEPLNTTPSMRRSSSPLTVPSSTPGSRSGSRSCARRATRSTNRRWSASSPGWSPSISLNRRRHWRT